MEFIIGCVQGEEEGRRSKIECGWTEWLVMVVIVVFGDMLGVLIVGHGIPIAKIFLRVS